MRAKDKEEQKEQITKKQEVALFNLYGDVSCLPPRVEQSFRLESQYRGRVQSISNYILGVNKRDPKSTFSRPIFATSKNTRRRKRQEREVISQLVRARVRV